MRTSLRCFSAFSSALPTPVARCRNPFASLHFVTGARLSRSSPYTSITDAMLQHAVQNHQGPSPKRVHTSVPRSAKHSTSLPDMMKRSHHSSHISIGGFANVANSAKTAQKVVIQTGIDEKPSSAFGPTNGRKRKSSEMIGLEAVLNRGNSFQNTTNFIDLTHELDIQQLSPRAPIPVMELNPDDFDDDSDLDLDIEYPTEVLRFSSAREPLRQVPPNVSQSSASGLSSKVALPKYSAPQSSVESWSSSPISHKVTPPAAHRKDEQPGTALIPYMSSEPCVDANPRPRKRRTVPWLQRDAENRERVALEVKTYEKNSTFESRFGFEKKRKEFTPLPKDKLLPWNTTASAVKDQQKAFKTLQRKSAKDKMTFVNDFQDVVEAHGVVEKSSGARPEHVCLSMEQQSVLDLVIRKKQSVFFTGSAGTGKSVLMRAIITELRKIYASEPDRVAVTASTGLAACNIGGVTLHSFSGIGLGKESVPDLVKKINRNAKAKSRWMRTKTLIIDEISMVDGDLFDKLEGIARQVKKNGRTFGGIQLVITGDFFQLPPVPDFGKKSNVKFAFDADTWSTAINHTIGLTEVFRQRDPVFANMLNEMRLGKITDETVKAFRRLERDLGHGDALVATELFPTRTEVDNSNEMKMKSLQGKVYHFTAQDGGTMTDIVQRDRLLAGCMAPPLLSLKKGAQVMLIKNLDSTLVNGSLGTVMAFMSEQTFNIYDGDDPSRFDNEEMGSAFHETKSKLKAMANKDLIGDTGILYPVVRFVLPGGGAERELLMQPEEWKIELPNGEVQAQRRQLPLILAWALSIHKAQGQTLERVKVDLKKVFENGQAYVALSRATSQEGLCVKNFNKKAVMAHPRVAEFYDSLYSVNAALKHPKTAPKSAWTQGVKHESHLASVGVEQVIASGFDIDEEEAMAAHG